MSDIIDINNLTFVDINTNVTASDATNISYDGVIIPPNSYGIIARPKSSIGKLTMGENSALLFENIFDNVELTVDSAYLDKEVKIGSLGHRNTAAPHNPQDPWVTRGWWQADTGDNGADGYPGINGDHGKTGANIVLTIGLNTLNGTLYVESIGGFGGDGSQGCKGQLGGNQNSPFHSAGAGGKGGRGGDGGNAGNGGNISVRYFSNANFPGGIALSASPGNIGGGGQGGEGASGGNNRSSGPRGDSGYDGKPGQKGTEDGPHLISKP